MAILLLLKRVAALESLRARHTSISLMPSRFVRPLGIVVLLGFSFWSSAAHSQTQRRTGGGEAPQQLPAQQSIGSINGTVVDSSGAVVVGARVTLTRADQSPNQEVLTGSDGSYSFGNV